jgi:4-hydroxybenzoate polyprenyltransferase
MSRLKTLLELLRFPALFTAMADIFAGYLFQHDGLGPGRTFGGLLACSSLIYLGGMVLNDVCDVEQDRRERPGRPIPSGRISRRGALVLAVVLLASGLAAGAAVSTRSGIIAAVLVVCVVAYDALVKSTMLGPVVMGACRSLNILLGMSTAAAPWSGPALHVTIALGMYILGLTWFARREASSTARWQLAISSAVMDLAMASLVGLLVYVNPDATPFVRFPYFVVIPFLLVVWIGRATYGAIEQPRPGGVQTTVGKALMGIIGFDASVVCAMRGPVWAVGVLLMLVPAMLLARRISPT